MDRPSTSKSRGICRYYLEPRGCFAGDNCKFLHAAESASNQTVQLTPYDRAKKCRYFAAGKSAVLVLGAHSSKLEIGFCRREEKCWFRHVIPTATEDCKDNKLGSDGVVDVDDELCSICLEKPMTYGLLSAYCDAPLSAESSNDAFL